MLPLVPTLAMTRLAVVRWGVRLRLLVVGRSVPVGQTVVYDHSVGWTAVRLRATAVTVPSSGIPACPVTLMSMVLSGPSAAAPGSLRVSRIRFGGSV